MNGTIAMMGIRIAHGNECNLRLGKEGKEAAGRLDGNNAPSTCEAESCAS